MRLRLVFTLLPLIWVAVTCRTITGDKIERHNIAKDIKKTEETAETEEKILAETNQDKIDPEDFKLENFTVSQSDVNDNNSPPWLTVTYNPEPESIEYKVCESSAGAPCETGSQMLTAFLLPELQKGIYTITVRPCVRPAKAKDSSNPCGKWSSQKYKRSADPNQALEEQLRLVNDIHQQLKALGLPIYEAMKKFKETKSQCSEKSIQDLIPEAIYNKYLALGPVLIGTGLEEPEAELSVGTDGYETITFPKAMQELLKEAGVDVPTTPTTPQPSPDGTTPQPTPEPAQPAPEPVPVPTPEPQTNPTSEGEVAAARISIIGGALVTLKMLGNSWVGKQIVEALKTSLPTNKKQWLWEKIGQPINAKYTNLTTKYPKSKYAISGGVVALGIASVVGFVYFVAANTQQSVISTIDEFGKALSLTEEEGPCGEAKKAVGSIFAANKEAEELRIKAEVAEKTLKELQSPQASTPSSIPN